MGIPPHIKSIYYTIDPSQRQVRLRRRVRIKWGPPGDLRRRAHMVCASKSVSRVLYLTVIYLDAPLPVRSSHPGSGRASLGAQSPCSHTGVVPDRVYSDGYFDAPSGELLPRLSTLTAKAQPQRRYISVALFLKSPSAGVTRYSCPVEPGLSS